MSSFEDFGYRKDLRVLPVASVQVAEAKHEETLQPMVAVYFRVTPETEQVGYVMPVELAEDLAAEIIRLARRAREKHWE